MTISQEQAMISDMIMSMMGVDRLAYVKPINDEEMISYAVYAADGTRLATFECRDEAFKTVRNHNLTPVNIH